MASGKKASSKSAGGFKPKAGPSGKMANFKGVGSQKPGVTSVSPSDGGGKYAKGGSGHMAKFSGVKNVKKA